MKKGSNFGREYMVKSSDPPALIHRSVKSIRNYGADETMALEKTLREICKVLGIKRDQSQEDIVRLILFLKNNYADLSKEGIRQAVDYALTGKIDAQLEHYQSLDIKYLSQILNAYRDHIRKSELELRKMEKQRQTEAEHQAQLNKTPEQRREDCRTAYEGLAKYVEVNKSLPIGWSWIDCYWYMEANGLVTKDPEEKKMFADYVRNMIEQEKKDAIATGGLLSGKNIEKLLNNKFDFAHRCRIEMVKSFFKQKINK
jgi:hypothetical protein